MNGNLPYYDIYDLRESDMAAMPVIYKAWKNSSDKELKDKLHFCAEGIMGYYSLDTDEPISYNYSRNKKTYESKLNVSKRLPNNN